MNFTPFPNLYSNRLSLRQMNSGDENEIFLLRSDERVLEFINITKAETIADAAKFIDKINNFITTNESIMWAICLKDSPKLIGNICFWNIMKEELIAEIGYSLFPEFQGRGIMQEAVTKVIEYGFETMHLNSIVADLDPQNIKSIKLLERNGFIYTGKSEEDELLVYTLKNPPQGL